MPGQRLVRPQGDRLIGGVCAGLARRYDWRVRTVRLVFVLSIVLPGPQVLLYLLLWIMLPAE